jgi:hypothetical protein
MRLPSGQVQVQVAERVQVARRHAFGLALLHHELVVARLPRPLGAQVAVRLPQRRLGGRRPGRAHVDELHVAHPAQGCHRLPAGAVVQEVEPGGAQLRVVLQPGQHLAPQAPQVGGGGRHDGHPGGLRARQLRSQVVEELHPCRDAVQAGQIVGGRRTQVGRSGAALPRRRLGRAGREPPQHALRVGSQLRVDVLHARNVARGVWAVRLVHQLEDRGVRGAQRRPPAGQGHVARAALPGPRTRLRA